MLFLFFTFWTETIFRDGKAVDLFHVEPCIFLDLYNLSNTYSEQFMFNFNLKNTHFEYDVLRSTNLINTSQFFPYETISNKESLDFFKSKKIINNSQCSLFFYLSFFYKLSSISSYTTSKSFFTNRKIFNWRDFYKQKKNTYNFYSKYTIFKHYKSINLNSVKKDLDLSSLENFIDYDNYWSEQYFYSPFESRFIRSEELSEKLYDIEINSFEQFDDFLIKLKTTVSDIRDTNKDDPKHRFLVFNKCTLSDSNISVYKKFYDELKKIHRNLIICRKEFTILKKKYHKTPHATFDLFTRTEENLFKILEDIKISTKILLNLSVCNNKKHLKPKGECVNDRDRKMFKERLQRLEIVCRKNNKEFIFFYLKQNELLKAFVNANIKKNYEASTGSEQLLKDFLDCNFMDDIKKGL
uniref:Uncharacterized protein n=1 Tax=Oxytricha trifallax TaxID=1172189 RepID=G9HRA4_9SPIT|nr:hypothetical protein [Oxytricha trifallax]